jgi:phytoene dehydrogenase-like protein
MRDAIIIGGGHNGLVAAAFLGRAGLRPLVIERADRVGGCAITSEIAPGFRGPTLAHAASIDPALVRALGLEQRGLQIIRPAADVCAPTLDNRALVLWSDVARATESIRGFSTADAEQYPRFLQSFANISGVLRPIAGTAAPSLDSATAADLFELLKTGRKFRSLGRRDAYRLLRWMPMAVADLAGEWFESEPLRATIASGGVLGSFLGPWSAGSAALLLLLGATTGHPVASGWFARGGTGAVTDALAEAAKAAGAEVRCSAAVARITVENGVATGVVLESGEEIRARAVVSNADPKRTLLGLVDPMHLTPELMQRVKNIRAHGTLAKVNYAVSALCRFSGLAALGGQQTEALSGRIRLNRNIDAIERAFDAAKYGAYSTEPWIELTIPSLNDPALAPDGQHVVSAYVQYAPYQLRGEGRSEDLRHAKGSDGRTEDLPHMQRGSEDPRRSGDARLWDRERDALGRVVTDTIAAYAPGFASTIVAQQVITPLDLERTYGLTGGHIFHGELALDQFFVTRPLLGWAHHQTPIRNLFLCGSGTHPGTGLTGRSGALAAKEIVRHLKRR